MINKPLIALITNHDDDVYCFRKELIQGIINAGYDMLISCPYGEKLGLLKEIPFIYEDINIDRRGINPINDLVLMNNYYKLLKKYRPNVVLNYTAKPNVYASIACQRLNIPYINNVTGLGSVINMDGIIQKTVINLFKFAFRKSSCVFFQNEHNMSIALEKGFVKGDYQLIPGSGVNVDNFELQDYPNGGNGIDGDAVSFNYIGRVLKEKGIDDYLDAAKIIKEKYPNTIFNVLGFVEPTEKKYIDKLSSLEKENIVKYHGQQKNVKPFIASAHAIIHPSVYGEGMSNVLLENASSGRPIITTNNPGCKETVLNNESGFIYKGGDVKELVEKIEQFLSMNNEARKQMGLVGREYVKNNFSRKIVVDKYLEKIKKLI